MVRKLALLLLLATPAFGQQHQIDLSVADTGCNTTADCTVQIYRVTCSSAATCPAPGDASYSEIVAALVGTTSSTEETWTYSDTAGLVSNTTYAYYATATYTTGGNPSPPSGTFQGTTPATSPPAPTITGTVTPQRTGPVATPLRPSASRTIPQGITGKVVR